METSRRSIVSIKKRVARCRVFMRRLPVSFEQLRLRRGGLPIFANGIPKSGTHLLKSMMAQFEGLTNSGRMISYWDNADDDQHEDTMRVLESTPRGSFEFGHIQPLPRPLEVFERRGFRTLLIIRDPRDLVCSHAKYAMRNNSYRFHGYYESLPDDNARIMAESEGISSEHESPQVRRRVRLPLPPIGERVADFLPWLDVPFNYTLRFEDLVGEQGGGGRELQLRVISECAAHCGLNYSDAQAESIASKVFDRNSPTFNRGKIQTWPQKLTRKHKDRFKELAGDLLIQMGYEEGVNW